MGWYGNWTIKYNGNDSKKFVNLAKLIIPNYIKRFEETETGRLECLRNLSWYNADVDISKIMEYLSETDTIDVTIDGETHPICGKRRISEEEAEWNEYAIEEDGKYYVYDELDYEKQTFKKENRQVVIDNEHPDSDRSKVQILGKVEELCNEIAYPEIAKENELEGEGETINSYIKYIAKEFAENDEFLPYVQNYVYSILDAEKLNELTDKLYNRNSSFSEPVTPDARILSQISNIRKKFKTVESTKAYLEYVKMKNTEIEKIENEKKDIPNFITNMSKRDINNLGGVDILLKMVELKGEESTKETLQMLGYSINDGDFQEKSSLEDLESEQILLQEKERQIKQSYEQYEQLLHDRDENIDTDR